MSRRQENLISESLKITGTIYRILKSFQRILELFPCENFTDIAVQFNRPFMLWQTPLKVVYWQYPGLSLFPNVSLFSTDLQEKNINNFFNIFYRSHIYEIWWEGKIKLCYSIFEEKNSKKLLFSWSEKIKIFEVKVWNLKLFYIKNWKCSSPFF